MINKELEFTTLVSEDYENNNDIVQAVSSNAGVPAIEYENEIYLDICSTEFDYLVPTWTQGMPARITCSHPSEFYTADNGYIIERFRKGESDILVTTGLSDNIKEDPYFKYHEFTPNSPLTLSFNMNGQFANPKLRQAISCAIDKAALAGLKGLETDDSGAAWGYRMERPTEIDPYDYNLKKADSLMRESGGCGIMRILTTSEYLDIAKKIAVMLSKISIQVEISLETNRIHRLFARLEDLGNDEVLLHLMALSNPQNTPLESNPADLVEWLGINGAKNFFGYNNPKVLQAANSEYPLEILRWELAEDLPVINLGWPSLAVAYHKGVNGIQGSFGEDDAGYYLMDFKEVTVVKKELQV